MSVSVLKEKVKFTYDDYLLLPDDGKRYQIIEGEIEVLALRGGCYESMGVFGIEQSFESALLKGLRVSPDRIF